MVFGRGVLHLSVLIETMRREGYEMQIGQPQVIIKEIDGYNALLIGPGLATEDTTKDMLLKLFEQTEEKPRRQSRSIGFAGIPKVDETETADEKEKQVKLPPLVMDADALNLLAKIDEWWKLLPENTILTPHPGEMGRLCGIERDEVENNRMGLAKEKAAEWNCIVLLKGAHTIIAAPNGKTAVLPFKTSALATAGSGDVLAGIIVSLLAQGAQPFDAAVAGGFYHGLAGTTALKTIGNARSVIATDLIKMLGSVL
jgi:NAD(P)H-hydrate epimerase